MPVLSSNNCNNQDTSDILSIGLINEEMDMNWDVIEGNWNKYKGHVKAQWGNLTNDHLDVIAGKRDQLVGQIQETYGIARDEADKQINAFQKYLKDSK